MYKKNDSYSKRAKQEGYLARSVYKLKEIEKKYALIPRQGSVLELGAAPGAWSQVVLEKLGPSGHLLGVDLQAITWKHKQATFLQGDVLEMEFHTLPQAPFDCILSDMAPKTSGIRLRDQALSLELCERALYIAEKALKLDGNFLIKIFESDAMESMIQTMERNFSRVERIRPQSTRTHSKEIYLLGLKRKNASWEL